MVQTAPAAQAMLTRRVTFFTFSLLLLAGGPAGAQQATGPPVPQKQPEHEMFFYSPDWRPGDIGVVAALTKAYFAAQGPGLRFQAFDRYEDLLREVAAHHPSFLTLPVWVAGDPDFPAKLIPLATPTLKSRSSYRKALMAKSDITGLAALAHRSLATTLPDTHLASLTEMVPGLPRVRIISVPKNIDALLALCFGQVDAALVTEAEYEKLRIVNPAITRGLITVAYTKDIPFPRYYATEWVHPDILELTRTVLRDFGKTAAAETILNMFGYDGIQLIPDTGGPPDG